MARKLTKLEQRISEVAKAANKTVVVGQVPHKDCFFATCGNIEWEGPTALEALETVAASLINQAAQDKAKAILEQEAAERMMTL